MNALRFFDAAARHLSFTRAAEELHVTQAAVSQQIKQLEIHLGRALFARAVRSLRLTPAGQELAAAVKEALDGLGRALGRLEAEDESGLLTISLMPSFAAKWLVPRLGRFHMQHPKIELRLHTSWELVDFRRADVDLAIRHGRGAYPGLTAELLLEEEFFPVANADIAAKLKSPADLAHYHLFQDQGVPWEPWLEAAGVAELKYPKGPSVIDSNLALQAAMDGQGVALGRSVLVAEDLRTGRLVKPFAISLPFWEKYWVVMPPAHGARAKVKAFRDWIFAEAEAWRREFT